MILKDNIARKITAALIILFVAFLSTSLYAQGAAAPAPKTDMTEVYKTAFTYILLFLSICLFIAIVGKSIRFYELTKQIEGKGEGINWNKVHAILFAIFLVLGLYGVYWEYTVHGSMILPDAASVHGKKIDEMFNLTLIITTIVFVVTHILLFGFAYFYKYSSKRKAYYYPHNNTIEKFGLLHQL